MRSVTKISELVRGDTYSIPLLLTGANARTSRNGKEFCTVTLTDGESDLQGNCFEYDVDEVTDSFLGKVVLATIQVNDYINIRDLVLNRDQNKRRFIKTAPIPSETMYREILEEMRSLQAPLRQIPIALYEENRAELLRWGAAVKVHHNIYGGLLYHSYRMMRAAGALCTVYSSANRELLEIGAVLHDIGKLQELYTQETGISEYTVDGTLQNHSILGVIMIRDAAAQLRGDPNAEPIDPEDLRLLEHMISSHHGQLEYGAIVLPATIEATLLNYLDLIDSRMYIFEDNLKKMEPGTLSDYIHALDGRVYKPDFD